MTLAHLLSENRRRFHHTYQGGLTNHLAMALTALQHLGATNARLDAFFDSYQGRLEPARPDPALGTITTSVRANRAGTIRQTLDALVGDVAGGAFHGVIRLAWAIDGAATTGDDDDVAHALVAFRAEAVDGPPTSSVPATGRERSLEVLAQRLRDAGLQKPAGRLISSRIKALADNPTFQAVVADIAVDDDTFDDVAHFGARLNVAADDFASLHVVTGLDALLLLRPFFADPPAAARAAATAALGCFVLAGLPALDDGAALPVDDDDVIINAAIATDDDHVAKFVSSCRRHHQRTGRRVYLALATRVSRRGTS